MIEDSIAGRESALDSGASAGPTVAVRAILIGAFISCALSLFLLALGAGLGLSAASPWPGSGISGRSAGVATGIFLAMTARGISHLAALLPAAAADTTRRSRARSRAAGRTAAS